MPALSLRRLPLLASCRRGGLAADQSASLLRLLPLLAFLFLAATGFGQERVLEVGDSVVVDVFQEPELHVPTQGDKAVLSKDGKLALPLIGEVKLAGFSTAQAAQVIAEKYKTDRLLRNPKVTVAVAASARKSFTILGAVSKPGEFYLPEGKTLTLLQAIGRAGGYSKLASRSKVEVTRAGSSTPIKLDPKRMAKEGETFVVQPGDVIEVKESHI